jgi:hypothetical protein
MNAVEMAILYWPQKNEEKKRKHFRYIGQTQPHSFLILSRKVDLRDRSEGSRSAAAAPPTPPTISSFCTISKVFISTLSFLQVYLAKGTTLGHIHLTGIEMQW